MTKYVKHKHGMMIGSDNVFFVYDKADPHAHKPGPPEGVPDFRDDYRALVSFEDVYCKQINTLNAGLRTYAHQIVWEKTEVVFDQSYTGKDGKTRTWKDKREFWVVNPWVLGWLNKNVGPRYDKWDTYTYGRGGDSCCLFFKRRKDALALVRFVQTQLVGIKVGLH